MNFGRNPRVQHHTHGHKLDKDVKIHLARILYGFTISQISENLRCYVSLKMYGKARETLMQESRGSTRCSMPGDLLPQTLPPETPVRHISGPTFPTRLSETMCSSHSTTRHVDRLGLMISIRRSDVPDKCSVQFRAPHESSWCDVRCGAIALGRWAAASL